MATNIGMMDSAYFVGRNEILGWINDRLHLNLSRIEEVLLKLDSLFLHVGFNGRFDQKGHAFRFVLMLSVVGYEVWFLRCMALLIWCNLHVTSTL